MILNRIGDFGILMAIFLTFWTFRTVDFYKPGEVAVVHATTEQTTTVGGTTTQVGGALDSEGNTDNSKIATDQLGIFGQATRMIQANQQVVLGPFTLPITTVLAL